MCVCVCARLCVCVCVCNYCVLVKLFLTCIFKLEGAIDETILQCEAQT